MKKVLPLLFLCTVILFFSCETTGLTATNILQQDVETVAENKENSDSSDEVSKNTSEATDIEPADIINEITQDIAQDEVLEAVEVAAEKIPQEELDEMDLRIAENDAQTEITGLETEYELKEEKNETIETTETTETVSTKPAVTTGVVTTPVVTTPVVTTTESTPPQDYPAQFATPPVPQTTSIPATASALLEKPEVTTTPAVPTTPAVSANPADDKTSSDIAKDYDFTESIDEEKQDENLLEELEPEPIVPSRTLTVKRNQIVDIIYPGTGWIYLGEECGGDHFTFFGRKLANGECVFTLHSRKSGTTILHFYKNDALTSKYIDDYIEINVDEENSFDTTHIVAPSYADVVPSKYERKTESEKQEVAQLPLDEKRTDAKTQETKNDNSQNNSASTTSKPQKNALQEPVSSAVASEKVQTVIQTSDSLESNVSKPTVVAGTENPVGEGDSKNMQDLDQEQNAENVGGNAKSLLEQAQKAYDEKRYLDALNLINQFFDVATEELDAGLYLEGCILESKSEVQNIKRSIVAYDAVVKNWPQSRFWKRANERSIYLKRFYIDIR